MNEYILKQVGNLERQDGSQLGKRLSSGVYAGKKQTGTPRFK